MNSLLKKIIAASSQSHEVYMQSIQKLGSDIRKNLTIIAIPQQKKEETSWLKDRLPLITDSIIGTTTDTIQEAYEASKSLKNKDGIPEFTNAAKTLVDKIKAQEISDTTNWLYEPHQELVLNCRTLSPPETTPCKGTILLFTGSHAPRDTYIAPFALSFIEKGYRVVSVDYPGFGKSTGKTKGINELRTAALMLGLYAKRTYPDSPLIPVGYSLGATPALCLVEAQEELGIPLQSYVLVHPMVSAHQAAEALTTSTTKKIITQATSSLDNTKIDTAGNIPCTMILGENDPFHEDQVSWYTRKQMSLTAKLLIHKGGHSDINRALEQPGLTEGMKAAPKGTALTPPPQRKTYPQTVTPPKSTTPPPAETFEEFSRKLSEEIDITTRSTLHIFDRNPSIQRKLGRNELPQSAWSVQATGTSKDVSPAVLEARALTETLNQMLQEHL